MVVSGNGYLVFLTKLFTYFHMPVTRLGNYGIECARTTNNPYIIMNNVMNRKLFTPIHN